MIESITLADIITGVIVGLIVYLVKITSDLRTELVRLNTIVTLMFPGMANMASNELIGKKMISKEEVSELIKKTTEDASRTTELKVDLVDLRKKTAVEVDPAIRGLAAAVAGFYTFMTFRMFADIVYGYYGYDVIVILIVSLLFASLLWIISLIPVYIFAKITDITKINLFSWKSSTIFILSTIGIWLIIVIAMA